MALTFRYKATNRAGRVINGRIKAPNRFAAVTLLRDKNFIVTEIKEVAPVLRSGEFLPQKRLSAKELALFCRQFATLTSSGIPIVQGLQILSEQTENEGLRLAIKETINNLEAGQLLSQAMSKHPKIFPALLVNMVAAGESSGSLDHVLDRLANYYEKSLEITEKLKSATTYPLFVLTIALATIICLFVFVLPTFTQILIDLQAPLSLSTKVTIKIGELLRTHWIHLLFFFLVIILGVKKYATTQSGKTLLNQVTIRLPIYGKLMKQLYLVQFSRTLAILLGSGISLLTSLGMVKSHVNSVFFQQSVEQAAKNLEEGNGLVLPLQNSAFFPPMVIGMIRVGEETGQLEKLLHKIADYYEQEVYQTINRLSSLLEPLLVCLVGGIIGLIMIAILLPVVNIMDSLQF